MRNWPGDAFHNKHRHRRNITFLLSFFHLFNYYEELFLWIQIFKYALSSLVPFLFICLRLNSLNLFVLILTNFLRVMIMMRVIQFWKCLCSRPVKGRQWSRLLFWSCWAWEVGGGGRREGRGARCLWLKKYVSSDDKMWSQKCVNHEYNTEYICFANKIYLIYVCL